MRFAIALVSGGLFALGLVISGMTTPAKVTGFLDVTGSWDPSLAFVMAAAIAVHAPFVRLTRGLRAPLFDTRFHWPTLRGVDPALIAGAAVFGVGWGLSGFCPGPALVSLGAGATPVLVFVGAMIAGLLATRLVVRAR